MSELSSPYPTEEDIEKELEFLHSNTSSWEELARAYITQRAEIQRLAEDRKRVQARIDDVTSRLKEGEFCNWKDHKRGTCDHQLIIRELTETPEYAAPNPLGGPARIFDAMANLVRAGEGFYAVLADYGFCKVEDAPPCPYLTGRTTKWCSLAETNAREAEAMRRVCEKARQVATLYEKRVESQMHDEECGANHGDSCSCAISAFAPLVNAVREWRELESKGEAK